MSLNGILSSALTALQTNTAALRVVSNNIANVNTPNYARRQVILEALSSDGASTGVGIADIQRVTDQFLTQESLSASASSSYYDTQSGIFDQISALLGSPGDGNALTSQLSNVFSALGNAALSPTTASSQNSVVDSLNTLATSISSLSSSLSGLASQTDGQLATSVSTCNSLIQQIYQLNNQIKQADAAGNTDTTYLDQRDTAIAALSQQMDVQTTTQSDGTMLVTTSDGTSLVGATYAQLTYTPGSNGVYQPIQIQDINPNTGHAVGSSQSLDPHLTGGTIKGLIDMRDNTIPNLENELGSFAQGVAQSFNSVHNTNSAYPPPQTLSGRQTGLLATDSLNFTGKTSITVTDDSGVQQHSIAIDFDAGTISVDGGTATSFGNTIGDFTTTLNGALSSCGGSASFTNGQLTLNAASGQGLVVSDTDASNPSSRGGTAFSQFFGLNDLFTSSVPSILSTGVSGSDKIGLASDGSISFQLKDANGDVAKSATVNITTGMSFNDAIAAINSAMNGYAKLTLNGDGSVTTSVNSNYPGYQLQVTGDTTARGTTGVSLTDLFGIGSNQVARQAAGFSLTSAIAGDSSLLALAKPDFSSSQIVGSGDSNGLLALQKLATSQQTFAQAGALSAQTTNLENYGAAFYQDFATRSASVSTSKTTADDRYTEAQTQLSNNSGVSLDEELSNLMMYQQAYSAGARMLTVVGQLYDTLLQIQ